MTTVAATITVMMVIMCLSMLGVIVSVVASALD